jgi:hypothetical protein
MHPRPGNLRFVAEQIEQSTGLRIEILGGTLVMSPTPCGKHVGTVLLIRRQIELRQPAGLASYEVSSISMPGDLDDYCTPDLVVLPESWSDDDDWLIDPREVDLAVEVIRPQQIIRKNGWYSAAEVRTLLVLDPWTGRWDLYNHPRNGDYHGRLDGNYGDPIPLPEPFGFTVETGGLPRYAR